MIIFDLDGTLIDSAPGITASMKHAWASIVRDEPFPEDRFHIGPPLLQTVARLGPARSTEEHLAIAAAFRAHYDSGDFASTLPFTGVVEALSKLANLGIPLAIATNKRRLPTLTIVRRWFPERFQRIACLDAVWPDDGTQPGSKAAMLGWLAASAGVTPDRAIMVGDAASDVTAARTVGMRSIAVTWGYDDLATLDKAGPDELVHDVPSLLDRLEALTPSRAP
jgi:phosphoglycolate phosphatase